MRALRCRFGRREIPGKEKPRPLTTGDQVIVSGIQRVRPGLTVDPKPQAK